MEIKDMAFPMRHSINWMLIVLTVFGLGNLAQAQNEQKKKASVALQLEISKTDVCAGEVIEITGKLENISKSPVTISPQHLWRYTTEVAYILKPTSVINIPNMNIRLTSGDGFSETNEDYVVLKPNEVYSDTLRIDSSKNSFYKDPGKYTLTSAYGQFRRFKLPGSKMFAGRVGSNTVTFFLKDCTTQ